MKVFLNRFYLIISLLILNKYDIWKKNHFINILLLIYIYYIKDYNRNTILIVF